MTNALSSASAEIIDGNDAIYTSDHSYLGRDLHRVSTLPLFQPGEVVELPTVLLLNLVAYPGQSVPLRFSSREWNGIQDRMNETQHRTFALALIPSLNRRTMG